MPTKRQKRFEAAVAEAASNQKLKKPRGRAMPDNMTEEGRQKGLSAMHSAKRCNRKNRHGKPCGAPAMRGSTRCLKHGGRVEVPDHPHNLKRFSEGRIGAEKTYGAYGMSDEEFWDSLTYPLRKEVLDILPAHVAADDAKLYLAARVWMEIRELGYPEFQRFKRAFFLN